MRKLLIALCVAMPLMAAPAAVTHAGGIQPYCVHSGNQCLLDYTAHVTNAGGETETVQWSVDEYSGDIESALSQFPYDYCYEQTQGTWPSQGPVTFTYYYAINQYITLTVYNTGNSSGGYGSDGYCDK